MTNTDFYEPEMFDGESVYLTQKGELADGEPQNRSWDAIRLPKLVSAATVLACAFWFSGGPAMSSNTSIGSQSVERAPLVQAQNQHVAAIEEFMKLEAGWDGYDAPAPNGEAARLAKTAMGIASAEGLSIDRIVPAGEGGIALCFLDRERYADIECLNDGEVFSALSDGRGYRNVIQVQVTRDDLQKATRRIGEFLGA